MGSINLNTIVPNTVLSQLIRFTFVGVCAAITHFSTVICLVAFVNLSPLVSNVFAYLLAVQVSFLGHRYFTFQHLAPISDTLGRFLLVAGLGFAFNQSLFYLFLHYFKEYYPIALIWTLTITPLFTFVLGKYWVFQKPAAQLHLD